MKNFLFILIFLSGCAKAQQYAPFRKGPSKILQILCRGNSLTYGSYASDADSSYPSRLGFYFGDLAIVRQQGIEGDQIYATMLTTFGDSIESKYSTRYRNIVVAWEITNELTAILAGEQPPEVAIDSTYERYKRFCLQSKGAKFTVIAGTCIARMGGGQPDDFDSCRLVINQRIRDNFPGLGIYVCDLAGDPDFDDAASALNTEIYNVDQVHLTDKGYEEIYIHFRNTILDIL